MNVFNTTLAAAAAAFVSASMLFAGDIVVHDQYARSATKLSKSGAAFMVIMNNSATDDRLIDVRSDVAKKVELHTHLKSDDGIVKMSHVPEGFVIPANGKHALKRGADHVMFMGLNTPMEQGDEYTVTLVFEHSGEIEITVPVDLERQDSMMNKAGEGHDHSN